MWFIRMIIEMPRAILTYRKTYKVAKKIERIRKHSLQAGYQYLLDNFPAAALDEEEYYHTLEEIKNLDDEGQLISFLELGCKLGFVSVSNMSQNVTHQMYFASLPTTPQKAFFHCCLNASLGITGRNSGLLWRMVRWRRSTNPFINVMMQYYVTLLGSNSFSSEYFP